MATGTTARVQGLDSVRGLAALTVVIHHSLMALPAFYLINALDRRSMHGLLWWLGYTPLHTLWDGHEAVILFFILSGFVLSLPYVRGKAPAYWRYAVKRWFRIYVPYAVVVAVAMVLLTVQLPFHGIPRLSQWFNALWSQPVTGKTVLDLGLMLGQATENVDTTTWSLVHEMRISLIFPLLMLLVVKHNWKLVLGVALAITGYCFAFDFFHLYSGPYTRSFGQSLYYGAFFLFGAVMAKHLNGITAFMARRSRLATLGLFLAALALYNFYWLAANVEFLRQMEQMDFFLARDLPIAAASMLFIMLAVGSPVAQRALQRPPVLWLGKVSYSLYLVHPLIILSAIYTLQGVLPIPIIVALVPPLSLLVAGVLYRFVEAPSMALGRRLAAVPARVDRPVPIVDREAA